MAPAGRPAVRCAGAVAAGTKRMVSAVLPCCSLAWARAPAVVAVPAAGLSVTCIMSVLCWSAWWCLSEKAGEVRGGLGVGGQVLAPDPESKEQDHRHHERC